MQNLSEIIFNQFHNCYTFHWLSTPGLFRFLHFWNYGSV